MIEKYWLLSMIWLFITFLFFGSKIGHVSFFDSIFPSNLIHIPLHYTTKFQILSYKTFGDTAFQKCPEEDKRIRFRIKIIRWNFQGTNSLRLQRRLMRIAAKIMELGARFPFRVIFRALSNGAIGIYIAFS